MSTTATQTLFNVYAVVNNKPIALQTPKPITRLRADKLADNLTHGKAKSPRVLVVRA